MKHKNAYDTLGVAKDADAATVKRAYRKKAARLHPDKPGGDKEAFQELNRAHKLLADPSTRAEYDKFGDAADSVQTLRQKAEAQLATMIVQCVSQCGSRVDVWQKVYDVTAHTKAQCKANENKSTEQATTFRDAASRLTLKDGNPTKLSESLESSAVACEEQARAAQFEWSKHEEILVVLREHKYRKDPPPENP